MPTQPGDTSRNFVTDQQAPSSDLTPVLDRNIREFRRRRAAEERQQKVADRAADRITRFAGSMTFVAIHALAFGAWIVVNLGLVPGIRPWDTSFAVLGMMASVEAIFLSTFILISQNRMQEAADKRAELDLHISLLAEHEITKLSTAVRQIAEKLQLPAARDLEEVQQDVAPTAVLDELERPDGP